MENFMKHNVPQQNNELEAPTEKVPNEKLEQKLMNATTKKVNNLLYLNNFVNLNWLNIYIYICLIPFSMINGWLLGTDGKFYGT
jgi:hypothetical protein